jgi:2-polyprenyl-3-methyl-5-hydroxy-6-metoxy-1,4-benzoquinol methylase
MNITKNTVLEQIQHQYNFSPYPYHPADKGEKFEPNCLFIHSLATAYYLRNRQVVQPKGRVILDAGCGSGYKALALAKANPGAQIIGIDISEASVQLARQRFASLGLENGRFEVINIEDVASLGLEFDYINCDEVLYLIPDVVTSLRSLRSVLKPQGILRGNLHSSLQRKDLFRAQQVFNVLGLMNKPEKKEIQMTQHILKALKNKVDLKRLLASDLSLDLSQPDNQQFVLMNLLLQNDQGFTIPEMFSLLQNVDLEFISMVNWAQWNLADLFQVAPSLLAVYGLHPTQLSESDRLHLFELFQPVHRLLDFWCGRPGEPRDRPTDGPFPLPHRDYRHIHLHPQLRTPEIKALFVEHVAHRKPFQLTSYLSCSMPQTLNIDSQALAALLPLQDDAQTFEALVARWLQVCPADLITLATTSPQKAATDLSALLQLLERHLFVFIEA